MGRIFASGVMEYAGNTEGSAPDYPLRRIKASGSKEGVLLIELDEKQRIIQEFVPGKQVTLAHVIANPVEDLYAKLGLIDCGGAIGIFTITPSEAAMIAADVATKAADVKIGFVDRFNGSLVITGDVAAVQAALTEVMNTLCGMMGFASAPITKT